MFIDTDSFDIPEPVGQTLAEVLFEQMDKRGYEVIVLDELEPASCIMSDIEIVKALDNPKTSLEQECNDPNSYMCAETEDLETIYNRGKMAKGVWLKEKKKLEGRAFERKPIARPRSDSSASAASSSAASSSSSASESQQL
jgi:hypothetical protein